MTRVPLAAAAAAAALLLLPACSGSSAPAAGPAATKSPRPSAPSPVAAVAEAPLTPDRAKALAADVRLRGSDVAGSRPDTSYAFVVGTSSTAYERSDSYQACLHAQGLLASSGSARLELDRSFYVGGSGVSASSASAHRDLLGARRADVPACLTRAVTKDFQDPTTSVSGTLTRVATSPPPGAQGAVRYVYQGTLVTSGRALPVTLDLVAVQVGRMLLQYEDGAVATSVPAAQRDRLLALLVRRAESAQHLHGR